MAMSAGEITTAVGALEKARESNDTASIVDILTQLEKISATESLLRETKVGVNVNKLKNYNDDKVVSMVKKMIKKWKDQISLEKKAAKVKKDVKREETAQKLHSTDSKPAAEKPAGPRTPKTDGIKVEPYAETTRNSSVTALYTALGLSTSVAKETILKVSTEIESNIYKAVGAVNDEYRNKLRSLIMSLRNKNNAPLRDNVLGGQISPSKLTTMSSQELAPESLKQQLQDMHQKNLFDAQGAVEKRAVTDRFVCGKCKQREVSYYQMQTRSADEPLTTFCTCEKCGNRWKFC